MADTRFLSGRFSEAAAGAAELHARQLRKGTRVPYAAHVMAVTAIALEFGANEDEAIAALLHDAIEDAPPELGPGWVRAWIRVRFGQAVLDIVEGCTDTDQQPKPPWRARKEAYVAHLRDASPSVLLVSAADKLHNTRAILRDVEALGDGVWERFHHAPEPRADSVVGYYRGLVAAFRARGEHPALVEALDRVVTAIEVKTGIVGRWPH
jgi:(p)ppGpp synthase/HD superfamily hydrolase